VIDERTPPHNIEAEESLLGAILLRSSILNELSPILDPSDFYASEHQHIYEGMLRLWDAGRAIDAITVHDSLEGLTSTSKLMQLQNATPSTSAFGRYADIVIEHSRRRRLIAHAADVIQQAYQPSSDVDRILSYMDPSADRLIAPRSADISGLYDVGSFMRMAQETSDNDPWLVPHILKPRWRVIIVAAEGMGKATLLRMIALHAAAGRDPWLPMDEYPKRRVLYVDVENATSSIQHQMRIANTSRERDLIYEASDHLHIWHREGGMDLRERRPRAEFEAVLQRTRPEIVFAGPLYKLFRKARGETDEQAALEFSQIIDDLRVRYNFAIVLEHHAPKASGGGYRELNPFGSSLWLRWPEFGITMEPQGNVSPTDSHFVMELGRFRRDREVADWPDALERGIQSATTPWTPRWFKMGRYERVLQANIAL
jgi:hypothetical protein